MVMNNDCIDAIFRYFEVSQASLSRDQADCVKNLKRSFQVKRSTDQAVDLERALEFYISCYAKGEADRAKRNAYHKNSKRSFHSNHILHEFVDPPFPSRPLSSSPRTPAGMHLHPKKVNSESSSTSSNDLYPPEQVATKKLPSPTSQPSQSSPPPFMKDEQPDVVKVTEARRTVEGRTVCVLRVDPRKDTPLSLFHEFAPIGPITALCFFSIENHARRKRAQRTLFLPRMSNHRGWTQWIKKQLERNFPSLTVVRQDLRENVFVEFRERSDARAAIKKIAELKFYGERLTPEMALDEFEPEQLGLVEFKTRADARKAVAKFQNQPVPRWKVELARTNFEITAGTKVLRTLKSERRKIYLSQPSQQLTASVAITVSPSKATTPHPGKAPLSYAARVSLQRAASSCGGKTAFIQQQFPKPSDTGVTAPGGGRIPQRSSSQRNSSHRKRATAASPPRSHASIATTQVDETPEKLFSNSKVPDLNPQSMRPVRSSRHQQQKQSKMTVPSPQVKQNICFRPSTRPQDEVLGAQSHYRHHGLSRLRHDLNTEDVDEFLLAATSVQHQDLHVRKPLDLEFDDPDAFDPSALLPQGLLGPSNGHTAVTTQIAQTNPASHAKPLNGLGAVSEHLRQLETSGSKAFVESQAQRQLLFTRDYVSSGMIQSSPNSSSQHAVPFHLTQTQSTWDRAPIQQLYYSYS